MTRRSLCCVVAIIGLVAAGWPLLRAEDSGSSQRKPTDSASAAAHESASLAPSFDAKVRPLLKQYCLGCHSTELKKGELDLERFVSLDVARNDLKPWQSLIEMLDAGEMPPKGKPRPTDDERKWLIDWTRRWLDLEARARAGDPGRAALRRLSNAEYNYTIRDLTGVDLQPTREFPADGAAGEGFTNAAEALSMSPTLVDKYLAAAKGIADHAVMLPDGFRFSPSAHQHDWIDESLGALHQFYGQFAEPDGRIPLRRYLEALVANRTALADRTKSLADVAKQTNLSAKYLEVLWQTLNDSRSSWIPDDIRSRWKKATPSDVPALVTQIEAWQRVAWKLDDKAACIYELWQVPLAAITDSQQFRVKLSPQPGQSEIVLYLTARTVPGTGGESAAARPLVIWDKARFEADKQAALALRDVSAVAQGLQGALGRQFRDTAKYLAAAAEWRGGSANDSVESIAKRESLDPKRLQRWIDAAGLSRDVPGPLEPLEVKITGSGERAAINGWGSKTPDTLPILLANSSDRTLAIPGTAPAHKVIIHPSPDEYVAVAWRSPIAGRVRIEAVVADAHAGCGNGVDWWLEHGHDRHRQKLVGGEFDDGKAATIEPREADVQSGDLVCLAVAAREHNHFCDTTLVDLTVTELDGSHRKWNLSADVTDNVLASNPHADKLGNSAVWHFMRGRDNSPRAAAPNLPAGSLLLKWREALDKPNAQAEQAALAQRIESLLTGAPPAAAGSADALLYTTLVMPGGPLLDAADLQSLLASPTSQGAAAATAYGLDHTLFGKSLSARPIPETAFATRSPSVLKVHLPAALVANRDFLVEARLDPAVAGEQLVQLQVSTSPPANADQFSAAPVLCSAEGSGRAAAQQALDEFRRTFPAAACFARIVPQDPDGITLCMFCREDEPLSRLLLDASQQERLERLWLELKYVGREAQKENESFPLFMAFASQVGLVPKFEPMRKPLADRAASFAKELEESEPKHLDQLLDFAARAYRRPLRDAEKIELVELYHTLRKKKNVSHEDALRGVLARVLIAPAFLFHLEQPPPGSQPQPLSDWGLASRLSYFLWSSLPDQPLRDAAAAGRLHEPKVLAEQTARMLGDPRVRSLAVEFGTQWIHVRGFDEFNEKNERLFPTFDPPLRAAIYEESIQFFQNLFAGDRPLTDILDADYTFLNEALAKHYGIPGVSGPEFRRIAGVRKYGRGGILALASVLSSQAGASRTSPTLRGNWVVETLLGEKLPRPPPNVPKLREEETGNDGLSVRQLVEHHASVAECAVCHRRIDPLGFSLERYDAIGRLREKDSAGLPIDCRAKTKDGDELTGLDGLRTYLLTKKRDVVVRLFCRRLLGYALGREITPADQPVIDQMIAAMNKNDGRISAAVQEIVASPQFRLIRGSEFVTRE